jgi:hypothetical protein
MIRPTLPPVQRDPLITLFLTGYRIVLVLLLILPIVLVVALLIDDHNFRDTSPPVSAFENRR